MKSKCLFSLRERFAILTPDLAELRLANANTTKRALFNFILLVWFGAAQFAGATIRLVTNTADSGAGSLRDTIAASAGGDTIQFSGRLIGTVRVILTGGELLISRDLTIDGLGRRILIDGNHSGRVFNIAAGVIVNLSSLTVTNGFMNNANGGGIYNGGALSLESCTFAGNTAVGSPGAGGGIYGLTGSILYVDNCTFSMNQGTSGGGIFTISTLTVNNSTFFSNTATDVLGGGGGGVYFGPDANSIATVQNSTFSKNLAVRGAGIEVGFFPMSVPMRLQNTIIADNDSNTSDLLGEVASGGFNLIGKSNLSTGWIGTDLTGSTLSPLNPSLGPLQNNGGITLTVAPLPGSAALDGGNSRGVTTDQIGQPRPFNNFSIPNAFDGSDIGAFEVQGPIITTQPQPPSQSLAAGQDVTYTVTATDVGTMSYHWRKNGINIAGATGPSYTLSNVQPGNSGSYSVVISDSFGASTGSDQVSLIVGFTLALANNGGGAVVPNPDQALYNEGSPVTLTAAPQSGWIFGSWSGDATGAENSLQIIMTTNKNITANFVALFRLTVVASGNGGIARHPDQAFYLPNSVVFVTATPDPGWGFSSWSGDGSGASNPLSVTMTDNKTITANFFQPTLNVNANPGGSVIKNPVQPTYAYNSTVSLVAVPVVGYSFTRWSGDASGVSNPLNLLMNNSKVVFAAFASTIQDLIVDNTNAVFTGSWTTTDGSGIGGGTSGPDFAYTPTVSSETATATFRPNIPLTGKYDVYIWFPRFTQTSRRCRDAQYFVSANGANERISVDEASGSGSGWQLLESGKTFTQGTSGFVRLSNQSTDMGRWVAADAVRWVWSTNQPPQPYITSITRSSGSATLTWLSASNYGYRLECKTNLTDAAWLRVNGDVQATGTTANKTDNTLGNAAQRFYQVELLQ